MTGVLGYRAASYEPVPAWRRWWPLARQQLRSLFGTRWGVGLFFLCVVPALVRLVLLLVFFGVLNFGPVEIRDQMPRPGADFARFDPFRVEFYVDDVLQVMPGMVFVLLLTTVGAARSIARDRTTNALELYWTRGIAPWTYLFAKWVGATLLVATLTVLAPL